MFNLEQSIATWRRQMLDGGIKSPEVLDELESHLREDIEKQTQEGAPAERAFAQAVERVGRADELKMEFGKIEQPRAAVNPRLISRGCVAMGVFMVATGVWLLSNTPIAERILGFVWLVLAGAYIGALPRMNQHILRGVRGWALRNAITIACMCFSMVCIALLLLGCANILLLPPIPDVIFWPLFTGAVATFLVLAHGTDTRSLGLWSPATQQCIELADEVALRYHHDFCGTEHVLLGLLETEDGAVAKVLGNMGVSRETVRVEIEKIVLPWPQSRTGQALVGTPRAKKAFVLGLKEAKALRCERMDPPHLLLGLLREGSGVAAIVLEKLGVNLESARKEVLKMSR